MSNVLLHARLEARYADAEGREVKREMKRAGFNKELLAANFGKLEKLVRRLEWKRRRDGLDGLRRGQHVRRGVGRRQGGLRARGGGARGGRGSTWDVGCNDGRYSRIAAEASDLVVAFDADHATVDALYRRLRDEGRDGHPAARHERHRPVARPRLARARAGLARAPRHARPGALPRRRAPRLHHRQRAGARSSSTGCARSTRALVIEFPTAPTRWCERLLSGKRDGSNPDYERGGVRARAGGAVRRSSGAGRGLGDANALRSAPADRLLARRAAPRRAVGAGLRAAAVRPARPQRASSSSRAAARRATSCCSRSATRCVPPLAGARSSCGRSGGSGRCSAGRAMLVLVALLVAALVLPPVGRRCSAARRSRSPVALLVGAGAAALYARVAGVRTFVTVLSPAPLVVLAALPRRLAGRAGCCARARRRPRSPARRAPRRRSSTSCSTSCPRRTLDRTRDGKIDAAAVPELRPARARVDLVPQRDDGRRPHDARRCPPSSPASSREAGALPTARDHPRNLFTLFERSHELTVVEPITDVCPDRLCADVRPATRDRLESLESDLEVVVQHLLLPDDLREGLPAIDRVWEGFERRRRRRARASGPRTSSATCSPASPRDDATAGFAARDRRARPPRRAAAAAVRPLDAPARRRGATCPTAATYAIDGQELPGAREQGAGSGRSGRSTRASSATCCRCSTSTALRGRPARRAARARPLRRRGDRRHRRPRRGVHDRPAAPAGERARTSARSSPVPFFVKLPGQRARRGRRRARCERSTCCRRSPRRPASRMPWKADGMPADERPVDPAAPIDVSHAGEPALTRAARLRPGQARARARRSRPGCCATASTRSARART